MNSYELTHDNAPRAKAPAVQRRWSLSTRAISVLTLLAILGAWWLVTALELIEPLFLPPP